MPSGAAIEAFEACVNFSYNKEPHLTSENIIAVACMAAFLNMTENHSPDNLLKLSMSFLSTHILPHWDTTIKAFKSTEPILSHAKNLGLVDSCLKSISDKAFADLRLLEDPKSFDEPKFGGARRRLFLDSFTEDITSLTLPLFELTISALRLSGIPQDHIGQCLSRYTKRWIEEGSPSSIYHRNKLKKIIESIEALLPDKRGSLHASTLLRILRAAINVQANETCLQRLENRIGMQLAEASVEDLLIPNYGYSKNMKYDLDSMKRILSYFIRSCFNVPSSREPEMVIEIMEEYAAEVAKDEDLGHGEFVDLVETMTVMLEQRGLSYDGVYRAVDIYLDSHGHLTEMEREVVCRVLNCRRLSEEACEHAVQNERLSLRTVAQVLFVGQLRIREVISWGESYEEQEKKEVVVMEDEKEEEEEEEVKVGGNGGVVEKEKKEKRGVWQGVKELFGCKRGSRELKCHVVKRVHP
ncbi:hypothetical protein J5N97_019989 [Dioscorea zingiberensis]|uniref:NPH3 domain-containing protein n=1 Tax=Dioscorea zingiberensis TaxID=325984 RepID=A0A9D5HD85_9LILI|nr:hypothetical protein J5N97_019989 [Dioscorea zingiberensis]